MTNEVKINKRNGVEFHTSVSLRPIEELNKEYEAARESEKIRLMEKQLAKDGFHRSQIEHFGWIEFEYLQDIRQDGAWLNSENGGYYTSENLRKIADFIDDYNKETK